MDYMHAIYKFGDVRIACESAWFHAPVQFRSTFRMQFERAVLEFDGSSMKISKGKEEGWTVEAMNAGSGVEDGAYIPQSNGYYNELRYFADCVKVNKMPDVIKPWELEAVMDTIAVINAAR